MKRALGNFILSPEFQGSVWGSGLRAFVRRTRRFYPYSAHFLLDSQSVERPHYAYCMLKAADLAHRLGLKRISVLEFGVAGGNGISFIRDFARLAERATGVGFDIYGFDTGAGMPPPEDYRDLPHWFRAEQYRMDEDALRAYVPEANLVIGNIRETVPSFVGQSRPAPIGAIFNDVDYHSSTRDSFALFDSAKTHPESFLPRIFMYFDDILGTELEMYGPVNGQLAAIEESNANRPDVKIHLNQNLVHQSHLVYRHQVYYAHLISHPRYDEYIGGAQQVSMQEALRLRPLRDVV